MKYSKLHRISNTRSRKRIYHQLLAIFVAVVFSNSLVAQACGFNEGFEPWKNFVFYDKEGTINGAIVFTKVYLDGDLLNTVCDTEANSMVIHYRVETNSLANGTYSLQAVTDLSTWRITDFNGFSSVTAAVNPSNNAFENFTGTFEITSSTPAEICLEMWFKTFNDSGLASTAGIDWQLNYIDETGNIDESDFAQGLGAIPANKSELIGPVLTGSPFVYSSSGDVAGIRNCQSFPSGITTSAPTRVEGDLLLDDARYCVQGNMGGPNIAEAMPGLYFTSNSKLSVGVSTDYEAIQDYVFQNACPDETWDGIYLGNGATLDLSDATIENWSTGIVAGDDCTVILKDCSITSTVDWDGITMGDNATLTIDGSTLEKIGDKIQLGENSTLNVINDTKIEHTPGNTTVEWNGIFVNDGSTVTIHKSLVRQADVAYNVSNSTIAMDDSQVLDCRVGFELDDADFSLFDRNLIRDCVTGILATETQGSQTAAVLLNIRASSTANATIIRDVDDAIISSGNWDMAYLHIYDAIDGIINRDATRAGVEHCRINADKTAINGENSYLGIEYNALNDALYGSVGMRSIRLNRCHGSVISNNLLIGGSFVPLMVLRSDMVKVLSNTAMTSTTSAIFQSYFFNCNTAEFAGNVVTADASRAAVRLTRSHSNFWQLNDITGLQANDVVQVVGSDLFESNNRGVNFNRIFQGGSSSDGIVLQDSPHSKLTCHDITTGDDAVKYRNGSAFTELLTNTLDGGDEDLITSSVLGVQLDHGNCFEGGSADASALEPGEVQESAFIYEANQPCLAPSSFTPSNWFREDGIATPACQPSSGGGFTIDDNEVCALVDLLEAKHNTEPNRYFIDMIHLVTYYLKDTSLTMPDCITASLDSLDPCGLLPMAEMMAREYDTQDHLDTAARATLDYHLTEIIGSTGTDSLYHAQQIEEAGVVVAESKTVHSIVRDTTLTGIAADLDEVSCADSTGQTWKAIFAIYVETMLADSLTAGQVKDLEVAASLCADDYGDPVHWARDLLLLYNDDQTDYSTYDDCIPLNNRAASVEEEITFSLFPNPSSGLVNIQGLDLDVKTHVIVYDMAGRSVATSQIDGGEGQVDLTDLQPGVYVLELAGGTDSSTHRIIIAR